LRLPSPPCGSPSPPPPCQDHCRDLQLLAVGDDFGAVSLYRYPAVSKGAAPRAYRGHSSHVTRVAFSSSSGSGGGGGGGSGSGGGTRYLFSTGGNDRALLQWEVKGL
jgi:hypothetical protein